MSNFADLIHELGNLFEQPLKPDHQGVCLLHINERLHVQIEFDESADRLLLFSKVVTLPPGKFREAILKDCLKANHVIYRHPSVLSYVQATNQLLLFQYIHAHALTAKLLYNHLALFVERAESWKTAIDNGKSSPVNQNEFPEGSQKNKTSIFGIA